MLLSFLQRVSEGFFHLATARAAGSRLWSSELKAHSVVAHDNPKRITPDHLE